MDRRCNQKQESGKDGDIAITLIYTEADSMIGRRNIVVWKAKIFAFKGARRRKPQAQVDVFRVGDS